MTNPSKTATRALFDAGLIRNTKGPEGRYNEPKAVIDLIEANTHADELAEALRVLVANAELAPDARMKGATDCYSVPLDDIEAARAVLAKLAEAELETERCQKAT